jgi:ribonuclease Y
MILVGILIGIIGGGILVFIIQNSLLKRKSEQLLTEAESRSKKILKDAEHDGETVKKEKILQAKERFLKLKEEHEEVIKERERKVQANEDRVKTKEKTMSQKTEEVARREKEIEKIQLDFDQKIAAVELKHQELDKTQQKKSF